MEMIFYFFLPTALALIGLLVTIRSRQFERSCVGEVIESRIVGSPWRQIMSVVLIGGAVFAATSGGREFEMLVPMILTALLVNHLRPREMDRVVGRNGVRVGWNSRCFSELEEWRLTGDHLRFKLLGQWAAVPLQLDRQAPVRERLREVAADRESAFNQ